MFKVVLLLALASYVLADCYISSGSYTFTANQPASATICSSLQSSCIHPDPSEYPDEQTSCDGGGDNPYPASSNLLNCTVSLANASYPLKSCPGYSKWSTNTENSIVLTYNPCNLYLGAVNIYCETIRGATDYDGNGPGSEISAGTITFNFVPGQCGDCTYGTCEVTGCVCPANKYGNICQYTDAANILNFSYFTLSALVLAVLSLKF
jgi:hypothetical protein